MREALFNPLLRKLRRQKNLRHIPQGVAVLDIGCGNGELLQILSPRISAGTGVDRQHPLLPKSQGNLMFRHMMIDSKLPLPDHSADVITMLAVLEHLSHPDAIVHEAYRILKPSGTLLLTTPTPAAKPILEFLAFKLNIVSRDDILDHKQYFWKSDLRSILQAAGFKENNLRHSYFQGGLNNFVIAKKL